MAEYVIGFTRAQYREVTIEAANKLDAIAAARRAVASPWSSHAWSTQRSEDATFDSIRNA